MVGSKSNNLFFKISCVFSNIAGEENLFKYSGNLEKFFSVKKGETIFNSSVSETSNFSVQ